MTLAWLLLLSTWDLAGILPVDLAQELATAYPESLSMGREAWVMEQLLVKAGAQGYFEAKVETTCQETNPVLTLIPGRRYQLGRLVIDGVRADPETSALFPIRDLEGEFWDGSAFHKAMDHLLSWYENNGHPFASFTVRHATVDSTTASLRMRVAVREGPRTIIERVAAPETVKTKSRIIARIAGISPGMIYDQARLDAARSRLIRTGYYEIVGLPRLRAGSSSDRLVVEFGLKERTFNSAMGAVGISREGTLTGSLQVGLKNIAGTAREVAFSWVGTEDGRSDLLIRYREPWLLGLPPSLELEVLQAVEDTLWVERKGAVALAWSLGPGVRGSLGYSTRRVIPGEHQKFVLSTRSSEGWGELVWDAEQQIGVWRGGHWVRLRVGYEQRKDLEEETKVPSVRMEIDRRRHVPLHGSHSLGFRLAWRQVVSEEDEIPVPDRFPLGGATSLRGYRERQFRSRTIGWLNTEYRFLVDRGSTLFAFFDVGVYEDDHAWEWPLGMGIGLRAQTAIGTLSVEYGIPEGKDLRDGRIHMALQQGF